MATLFVDYENGNNNYGGTSFDLIISGTDGQISGNTFTSDNAEFGDNVINQYLSIFNGSSYLTYEITAKNSSTELTISQISGGNSLQNINVDRQYYIGGRWKDITNGATSARIKPGDTVRIMGSPNPTSLGIGATWRLGDTNDYFNSSFTEIKNATPILCTTSTNHSLTTGDTIYLTGVNGLTNANGVWEVNVISSTEFELIGSSGNADRTSGGSLRKISGTVVMLDAPLTKNIASTGVRSAWTALSNATANTSLIYFKEHYFSDSISVGFAFTTGKAAYYTLPSTLDLSDYQQVSFWIRNNNTITNDNDYSFTLCSDSSGDDVVNTINIPKISSSNCWVPITVNVGIALSNSINSIALNVNVDSGSNTFYFSNIIACKSPSESDSLTLNSLIGKNISDDTWYNIQSIDNNRVIIDGHPNFNATDLNIIRYIFPHSGIGLTENVTTYKRECIKTDLSSSSTTNVNIIQDSGTVNNLIKYEGGWDRTDMSNQNIETWFDGRNGQGRGIYCSSKSYVFINNIAVIRYYNNYYFTGTTNGIEIPYIPASNNDAFATGIILNNVNPSAGILTSVGINTIFISTARRVVPPGYSNSTIYNSSGVNIDNLTYSNSNFDTYRCIKHNRIKNLTANNNGNSTFRGVSNFYIENFSIKNNYNTFGSGISLFNSHDNKIGFLTAFNSNSRYLIEYQGSSNNYINSGICTDSTFSISLFNNYESSFNYIKNFITGVSNEYNSSSDSRIYSHNHNNISNNHVIFSGYGKISSDTVTTATDSGLSWKIQPKISLDELNPLRLSLAKIAVDSNFPVSISCSMRRDNTNLTMKLSIPDNQISGIVTGGISSSMTASANQWENVSLSFTPLESGVVEIFADAYGGTTYTGYVDNMTITQQ